MKIEHIAIVTITALTLTATACTDADSSRAEPVERVTAPTPILTATAPSPAPSAPLEAEAQSPSTLDPPDAELGPKTFEAETEPVGGMSLTRFVTTSSVESREPSGAASHFASGVDRVYAFIEARNDTSFDETLRVHFIGPDGKVSGGIDLEIPASAPRWRTWAYTRHANEPGLWRVEVRDLEGALLGALPFEIEPIF
jgi:hypothetical protein